MNKTNKVHLTKGPLFLPILKFALPLMLSGILQSAYNAADSIIVGKFSGDQYALGAIGSTTTLINLMINVFIALTAGSGVVIAQMLGAKKDREVSLAVHTSIAFSIVGGIAVSLLGILISRPVLEFMGTKPEFIENATLYIRIVFLGIPGLSVYNFASTILRSNGDSKTPLIILGISGGFNVLLNVFFVCVLGMSVEGVALATIISQYLSAAAVLLILIKSKDSVSLNLKKIKFDSSSMKKILKIGIPSAINVAFFNIANVVLQSAINQFNPSDVEGYTVSNSIEGFVYFAVYGYLSVAVTFIGQNYGAKNPKRIKKSLLYIFVQCVVIGLTLGLIFLLFSRQLASLYVDMSKPNANDVIEAALVRMRILLPTYFLCGVMDLLAGYLRGLGRSLSPTVSSLIGVFALRMLWVIFIFPLEIFHSPFWLYITWPLSWIIVIFIELVLVIRTFKELRTMNIYE